MAKAAVIESNIKTLDLITEILEFNSHQVVTCTDGAQVFDFIKKQKPNLIIISANLSNIEGHKITEKILKDENLKNIPVIIISGENAEEKFKDLPVTDFLPKPFKPKQLIQSVNDALK
jgi:CheY-like chemotaxis protein